MKRIPCIALVQRPGLGKEATDTHDDKGPYKFACYLYGLDEPPFEPPPVPLSPIPLHTVFHSLVTLTSVIASQLSEVSSSSSNKCREAFLIVLDLLATLATRLEEVPTPIAAITWNPSDWLSVLLPTMESKV